MGIYSTNRYGSVAEDFEVVAAEGYNGEIGAAIAMIEGYQNDMALFNGVIATDFQEAAMIHEGASEEEVYALQEGALKGAWEKLKEFFKKLIEKIKGIFHAFIVKMESVFMKDSKEFYKKHIAEVNKKSSWEGFKCKVKMLKKEGAVIGVDDSWTYATSIETSGNSAEDSLKNWDTETEFKKIAEDMCSGTKITASNSKEFEEAYMEAIFNDEETKDDWTLGDITGNTVGKLLQDNKGLSNLNKANATLEKNIKKIIDKINKAQNDLAKVDRDGKDNGYTSIHSFNANSDNELNQTGMKTSEENLSKWQKAYEVASKKANVTQDVIMAYTSSSVKAYKEAAAQARRVFAAAVTFAPKSESVLAAAVGDVAYYEACDLMDTMYDM